MMGTETHQKILIIQTTAIRHTILMSHMSIIGTGRTPEIREVRDNRQETNKEEKHETFRTNRPSKNRSRY